MLMCQIKHDDVKTNEGLAVKLHTFLNVSLDGNELSALGSCRFTQGKSPGVVG